MERSTNVRKKTGTKSSPIDLNREEKGKQLIYFLLILIEINSSRLQYLIIINQFWSILIHEVEQDISD